MSEVVGERHRRWCTTNLTKPPCGQKVRNSTLEADQISHRLAADIVSSMTETEALRVYHRITGVDHGQLMDAL